MMTKKSLGRRWGLVPEAVHPLGHRLHECWERYRSGFKTQTRDGSAYARHYLNGLLRMEKHRHDSGIGQEAGVAGQHIQHFMSHSPWSAEAVYRQVQDEWKTLPELTTGGVLLVDESADEKASAESAGAAGQAIQRPAWQGGNQPSGGAVELCEPHCRVGVLDLDQGQTVSARGVVRGQLSGRSSG